MADILVIGYGNELRGDDAAGPAAARRVEALQLAGVRVLVLQQLAPELAEDIAAARAVIFVDAYETSEAATVETLQIKAAASQVRTHASNPQALLALAESLFGHRPPAWLVTIPATDFGFTESLSPLAEAGMAAAIEEIRKLCALVQAG